MRGTFPVLVAMVKDQGPLGGNLTVCWAAEIESSQVASLNLGWQRRWTPFCIVLFGFFFGNSASPYDGPSGEEKHGNSAVRNGSTRWFVPGV